MDLVPTLSSFARRCALLGTGSGFVAVAAVLARGSGSGFAHFVPGAPSNLASVTLPFVSLLALVGPTGLQFPCWAVESTSPGARLYRWARRKLAR
ncbi:MAG: hypothetical protein ACHQ16_04895 [Candidatus Lutacidiplasmatales archaeon]